MKNTPLHAIARGIMIFACLVILFFAGAWVGCTHLTVDWRLATLASIAVVAISSVIWYAGRYSRGLPKGEDEEEEQ